MEFTMNPVKTISITALSCLALLISTAHANPLTLGASMVYDKNPYKQGKARYYPVPIINYDGDRLYLHTAQAGYYLWKDEQDRLSLTLLGSPQHFATRDTDSHQLKQLNERHMTVMAGMAWRHTADWGVIRTLFAGDLLDNSNGFVADVAYLHPFRLGALTLSPGIGVLWSSQNQNHYYYGISKAESKRSGLASYQPDDSWQPYAEVSAIYAMTPEWRASLSGRYSRLSDEQKNSPMVNSSSQLGLWGGISYTF
ncbi:MAG: MltA-interacting protein [Candidatus Erwinia impunctatus]|nr:MltA-interacting protein [Culicoides impunctatus]